MSFGTHIGDCLRCEDKGVPIVNKRHGLCNMCNKERLGSAKVTELGTSTFKPSNLKEAWGNRRIGRKGLKSGGSKASAAIKKDEEFYEHIWESRKHLCAECGKYLGDDFRDDKGKVIDRFRYSHILGKKSYPMFRHREENIDLLCLHDHDRWGKGDTTMKIWSINQIKIKKLQDEIKR